MALDKDTTALVTGASSGIGEATARALRAQGVKVYAAARRIDRLETLAGETGCIPIQLDVRDRQAVKQFGEDYPVDILVNNAGLGRALGSMWDAEIEDIEMTVDTNVISAILMIKAVLPGMIERGRGHIVNMSSVTALYPLPRRPLRCDQGGDTQTLPRPAYGVAGHRHPRYRDQSRPRYLRVLQRSHRR